jgi:acetyl esterase
MKRQARMDPELEAALVHAAPLFDGESELATQRLAVVEAFERMGGPARAPRIVRVPRATGAGDIELRIYASAAGKASAPALYTIHGGGYVMGSAAMMDAENWRLAEDNELTVVAVDYRLAPEVTFPEPLEDCYTGLVWVFENASWLSIDASRIVVMGESAGGGLAAAVTLFARDRDEVRPAAQMLLYPMLDHRTGAGSALDASDGGLMEWVSELARFGWRALRGSYALDDDRAGYFSPALANELAGLPPTFLAVGALDLFVDEDIAYALSLLRAGVSVECHVYPGAVHGFDKLRHTSIAQQLHQDRRRALSRWFRRSFGETP